VCERKSVCVFESEGERDYVSVCVFKREGKKYRLLMCVSETEREENLYSVYERECL